MTKFSGATIGVTGASGNLGRQVIKHLQEGGATHIVALTRNPDKLRDLGAGVQVRKASFDEPAGLAAAFAGVERLLIVSTDTLEGRTELQAAAVDAAVQAGVRHIAYTGIVSPYPDADPNAVVPNSHYWTEVRIAASGVDFSFLRNNIYTDYLIPAAQNAIASGTLYHASGDGRRAYVTREDCAVAAASVLLTAEGKRVFEIGGPQALSSDDIAAILTKIKGKPVKAVNVPVEGLVAGMVQAGLPNAIAGVLAHFDTDVAKGYLAIASDFQALTGRPPHAVADFLAAHRKALSG